jgi:hypothetical protein
LLFSDFLFDKIRFGLRFGRFFKKHLVTLAALMHFFVGQPIFGSVTVFVVFKSWHVTSRDVTCVSVACNEISPFCGLNNASQSLVFTKQPLILGFFIPDLKL